MSRRSGAPHSFGRVFCDGPVRAIGTRDRKIVRFFFFNDTATTEIYTLPLHDALPISLLPPAKLSFLSSQFAISPDGAELAFVADRKSTRLNSSHLRISYGVFCLKKSATTGWLRAGACRGASVRTSHMTLAILSGASSPVGGIFFLMRTAPREFESFPIPPRFHS